MATSNKPHNFNVDFSIFLNVLDISLDEGLAIADSTNNSNANSLFMDMFEGIASSNWYFTDG